MRWPLLGTVFMMLLVFFTVVGWLFNLLATELSVEVEVKKESNPQTIMEYGVMSTPAVVIDERLVHAGSIPHTTQIKTWLTS